MASMTCLMTYCKSGMVILSWSFLGDLIDRGENSRAVLEKVRDLVNQQGAICLSGNHEFMFLTWLDNPAKSYDHYRRNGGDTTINSILGRPLKY